MPHTSRCWGVAGSADRLRELGGRGLVSSVPTARLDAEFGYRMGWLDDRALITPFAAVTLAGAGRSGAGRRPSCDVAGDHVGPGAGHVLPLLHVAILVDTYYKGDADPTPWGHAGVGTGQYIPFAEWPDEVKWQCAYDPAEAERLLDDAGYPRGDDGIRFSVGWDVAPLGGEDVDLALLATNYWDQIGVDAR